MLEAAVILALILANGVFAMAEIAVVSANRLRLRSQAEKGDAAAEKAAALAESPIKFLSTVQIGITLITVFSGAFGGAALAGPLSEVLARSALLAPFAYPLALFVVVVLITYLSVVVGELVPKRLALRTPEAVAMRVAPLMTGLSRAASPLVAVLSRSTNLVLRVFGVKEVRQDLVGEEDISLLVEEGLEQGTVEPAEREIIENAFWLGERRVTAIQTPRRHVAWLDARYGVAGLAGLLETDPHSRYLVSDGDIDKIRGTIRVRDLLPQLLRGEEVDLESHVREPLYVPETMPILSLLERFKSSGVHFAVVLDEYGGVDGIVTVNDVLEELVGDVPTAEELAAPAVRRLPGRGWSVAGDLDLEELLDVLEEAGVTADNDAVVEAAEQQVRSVGGYLALRLGRVPKIGDSARLGPLKLTASAADHLSAKRVRVEIESS